MKESRMSKIVVGMSGGVDSAVTAYLLKAAGHEVIGVTLKTWVSETGELSRCCEIDEAGAVCDSLGIPFYAVNCMMEFRKHVTEPFVDDYVNGRTPNPCVECNKYVKWEQLLKIADSMGAQYVATGHYAYIDKLENGRYAVRQAEYAAKDQTYMLYKLTQEQLSRTIMPLGKLSKDEVRKIAESAGIPVAHKADSQEICFVPDGDYGNYIESQSMTDIPQSGNFVDEEGNVLGKHKGIIHYTVGQRRGLGLALGYHAYVKKIDVENNTVVISTNESLFSDEITCDDLNFMSIDNIAENEEISAVARIRYHHAGEKAVIRRTGEDELSIKFEKPVRAATPGQSVVFYDNNGYVIGGGKIK
ncbi:tRNA 2-thiouridine(34) synthase MnmA [Butyrivibrio sp. NC2002]|uniref:tRNA 2-thiouridine(34) synthase MnmA n=1 Tax=Butyrivibrio sp. NC2002 TaxID=1410610 RepID=UPI000A5F7959|nr:tRNA 2-thiouridine(34) synthase MnmA [Butyrivibrio sp. NC2002]